MLAKPWQIGMSIFQMILLTAYVAIGKLAEGWSSTMIRGQVWGNEAGRSGSLCPSDLPPQRRHHHELIDDIG